MTFASRKYIIPVAVSSLVICGLIIQSFWVSSLSDGSSFQTYPLRYFSGSFVFNQTTYPLADNISVRDEPIAEFIRNYRISKQTHEMCSLHKKCPDYTEKVSRGSWYMRPHDAKHLDELSRFQQRVRQMFHSNWSSYQRLDGVCGNRDYVSGVHFRAICESRGPTPCCYNNTCQSVPMGSCNCPGCFDTRFQLHAEISEWRPEIPECQPAIFDTNEICSTFKGKRLLFIGDSLVRHLFSAFRIAASGNTYNGSMKANISPEQNKQCSGMYAFTEKECRHLINRQSNFCNGTVTATITGTGRYNAGVVKSFHQQMKNLVNKSDTFVIINMGVHDLFKSKDTIQRYIEPPLRYMEDVNADWPKVLWLSQHKPGLLKSAELFPHQRLAGILAFNVAIEKYLANTTWQYLDMYNFTESVVSFDGYHYGIGLNLVKLDIVLQYIKNSLCSKP